jgi:hypothetical protein
MAKRKAKPKAKGGRGNARQATQQPLAVLPDPASTGAVKLGTLTYTVKVGDD